ncbi:DNA/RNA helicase, DEAD/DEAH box type, N-terminal [Cinnamomum micranthum f. kanehirae]|uniref:RNA helicase n=1 Tax=Cinnamomum micranthum f. kanehirae TaxID=337451 RepID=A0A3S3N3E5_9MAGN|nr:DNA/RNA helicase, DEAD/DEAH box type, N-terminal [Cinnamomum micranthum f. kanehirae]
MKRQPGRAEMISISSGNRTRVMILSSKSLPQYPYTHNQQEMRMGTALPKRHTCHHGDKHCGVAAMTNVYNHFCWWPETFPNNAPARPSPRNPGFIQILQTSLLLRFYRDNVPAPFMTFEATGFPPEILREVSVTKLSLTGFKIFTVNSCLLSLVAGAIFAPEREHMSYAVQLYTPITQQCSVLGRAAKIYSWSLSCGQIQMAGFSSPTPIQAQKWPIALQSRDIVAIAKTGSGKTLGYLLPAFIHLRRSQNNPQASVQIFSVLNLFSIIVIVVLVTDYLSWTILVQCLYGGAPKGPQLREIERGADIVVATGPSPTIRSTFRQVSFLVLDEADRMLDMGFEPQIRKIVNEIPPRRQTLMYTATWPKEVRKIAGDLLVNPVQVNIGSVDELAANKSITQYVEVVPQMEKQRRLEQILRSQERGSKVIIFCSTKRLCDHLARSIGRLFGAAAIHGDKTQDERDWVLNQFRSGKSPILVATDVAARGLDIKDIRVVINYDFPTGIEDYVHRIGRTGRAGATGDWKYAADLVKVLEGANQRVPPEVREIATRGAPGLNRGRGGISRWDSGGGRRDSGGRGGRDNGFGSRGGRGDGGFGGRGGRGDSGFGNRGGRGDSGFGNRGGRNDFFGGRGNRGRGFGGPGGRGRHDRAPHDRYDNMNGRGRYDERRGIGERNRGRSYSRSYSPSPDRVRTWDYSRRDSRSRSRSRSWTRSRSGSRSRSHSYDRYERDQHASEHVRGPSGFDVPPPSQMFTHVTRSKCGAVSPEMSHLQFSCWLLKIHCPLLLSLLQS